MGGRGAAFKQLKGKKRPWDKSHPMPLLPKTLGEALGEKGRPLGIAAAYEGANPFFGGRSREFTENCQRCVVAYELRRRGYDVTAQSTFEGDTLPRVAHRKRDGASNSYWMGAFRNARSESLAAGDIGSARDNLKAKMAEYGHGSRAIVRGVWSGKDEGHVFNVENKRGRLSFVDAQTGRRYNPSTVLSGMDPRSIQIVRTDNLRISPRVKDFVWKEGT